MPLTELWHSQPDQLLEKHVQQVIAFAGDGRLLDGGNASEEFRAYLAQVPSAMLARYGRECLTGRFDNSGLALQDVVNEMGQRLGYDVERGPYRGSPGKVGFDGIWSANGEPSIIVEVKTTDAYRVDLNTLAKYRSMLTDAMKVPTSSSILIVVGRQDTGDLEAQVRGSRHAWDMRLISVDALVDLMNLKEKLDDPVTVSKIRQLLVPTEFTKLDAIVNIAFLTAADITSEIDDDEQAPIESTGKPGTKFTPVAFHLASLERAKAQLNVPLVKTSRSMYGTADKSVGVVCIVSREHGKASGPNYWYAFHPHQQQFLGGFAQAYVVLGCGSPDRTLLVPWAEFEPRLVGMNKTEKPATFYWHISISRSKGRFVLHLKKGFEPVDWARYLL